MLKKTPKTSRCFEKLLELNQLPADKIESSFEHLFESSKIFDNEFLKTAFNCYREFWIKKITPQRFSCYENRNIKLAKIAKKFETINFPDVAKWTSVFKQFKIWKFTGKCFIKKLTKNLFYNLFIFFTDRLLDIMIILRSKIHLSID